jgi:hypothetical protein
MFFRRAVILLLVVDLPILLAIILLGAFEGYEHAYDRIMGWRMHHTLLSFVPSMAILAFCVIRWWPRRRR